MKQSDPALQKSASQSIFQKQRSKRASLSPLKQNAAKSISMKEKEKDQAFRRKEGRKTTKTYGKQSSHSQNQFGEQSDSKKQVRTLRLIGNQGQIREGTSNSRTHSIHEQLESQKHFFKSKVNIREGTANENSKPSRQSLSHIDDIGVRSRSNFSIVQNESEIYQITKNLPILNKQQKLNLHSDLDILEQREKKQQQDSDDYMEASIVDKMNVIEEEHNKFVINESLQRSASKSAFEKKRKRSDYDQIDEQYSQENSYGGSQDELLENNENPVPQRYVVENQEIILEDTQEDEADSEEIRQKQIVDSTEKLEKRWYNLYVREELTNPYPLEIRVAHDFEWIIKETKYYSDPFKFLYLRKCLFIIITSLQVLCYKIARSTYFDYYEILVTMSNIILFLSDSNGQHNTVVQSYQYVFISLYFLALCIQFIGKGIKAFITDLWNFYDSCILVLYAIFIFDRQQMPLDVSTFRVIRIPFYLGKLNKNLNIMLHSLKDSYKFIVENLLILVLFSVLLSIIALNLFQGVLKYRCMSIETGVFLLGGYEQGVCGYVECDTGFICAKQLYNIDIPTNFDKMQFAYTQIIRTTLINDWTISMYMLMKQFHPLVCLYYILITFIVDKFCFQLVIAVLKVYYHRTTEHYHLNPILPDFTENQIKIDQKMLIDLRLWNQLKQSIELYKRGLNLNADDINKQNLQIIHEMIRSEHIQQKQSISSGSLSELMNKPNTNNNFDQQKEKKKKEKLLSARQTNEAKMDKAKEREKYASESWIIDKLYPNQYLQHYMAKIIDDCESLFREVNPEMDQFYRFRSADFFTLQVVVKKDQFISTSTEEVLHTKEESQIYNKFKKQEIYYDIDKILSNVSHKAEKYKQKLPIRKRFQLNDYLEGRIMESPRQLQQIEDISDEEDQMDEKSVKIRVTKSKKTILRQTMYQADKKITFDQQLKMAKELDNEETAEKKTSNIIIIDGQVMTHETLKQYFLKEDDIEKEHSENDSLANSEESSDNESEQSQKQSISQDKESKSLEIKNYQHVYNEIHKMEQESHYIVTNNWSGNDIVREVKYQKFENLLEYLNKEWRFQLSKGVFYQIKRLKLKGLYFITHPFITISIDSLVCINTIILAFNNYFPDEVYAYSDITINIVLLLEMTTKGICAKRYFRDTINILECLLILISTFERVVTSFLSEEAKSLSSILLYLRVMKALYFFRVIKYNVFAINMIRISYQTFPSYANMALLLFFLILNYALFGLQIFYDKFPLDNILTNLHYFGNAYQAWIAVFDISTGDDWYGVVILSNTYTNQELAFVYCISIIFIINYLTFGLLLAIILDGFNKFLNNMQELEEEEKDQEEQLQILSEQDEHLDQEDINEHEVVPLKRKKVFTMLDILENLIKPQTYEKYLIEVKCKESLLIFKKKNKFRKICYLISENLNFKIMMQIIAWGSLVNMIVQTFYDYESTSTTIFDIFQIICNLAIMMDGCMRIVAFGAIGEQGYFHSLWVTLDFIYVFLFFIHLFLYHPAIESLLFIGFLRPLKVTSYSGFFQNERGAILQSMSDILSILYVIFLFWFVFGIFGMTIYKDQMGYCDNYTNFGVNRHSCTGEWKIYPHNFDTIINSMQTLFILSTFDGWGVIFFICVNSNTEDYGPLRFNSEWPSYLFFVLFQFIGSLFFLGFFAGILFINFKQKKSQLLNPDLTFNQELFLKISDTIMVEVSTYSDPPKKGIRLLAQQLLTSKYYIYSSKFAQFLNLMILMMYKEDGSDQYLQTLNMLNHFFSLILFLDLIVKMLTYHVKRYFGDNWRRLEFIFVLVSIVDFWLDMRSDWVRRYSRTSRDDPLFVYLRLFYVFRGLRMTLIIQLFTGIRRLLNVIAFNIMAIVRIVGLFITVLTCYSYIGCSLFGQINKGDIMHDQLNYQNFFYGLLTLFKVQTKNGWRNIMTDSTYLNPYCKSDHNQCGQSIFIATVFYFSCIMIASHVLMNLIVCELVEEFERFYDTNSNVIETYVENIDKFRNLWCKYSQDYKGTKMHTKYLGYFLLELSEPYGMQKGDNLWDAAKHASTYQLRSDINGCISFRGLLYECVKSAFRESIFEQGTIAGAKIMKRHDKKIRYRLYNQRTDIQHRRKVMTHVVDLEPNFNILQEYLYVYMSLKAWKSFGQSFMEAARNAENTVVYSEADVQDEIHRREVMERRMHNSGSFNDDQSLSINSRQENDKEEQQMIKHFPSQENLRRQTDVYILSYYEQQLKHKFRLKILNRMFQQKKKDDFQLIPSTDQKTQKRKEQTTIKKKQQLIKVDELRKLQENSDKPQFKSRYQYGYHEKQVVNMNRIEEIERLQSRMDIIKNGSNMDVIGKARKSIKFKQ